MMITMVPKSSKIAKNFSDRVMRRCIVCVLVLLCVGVTSARDVWAVSQDQIDSMETEVVIKFCSERDWLRCFNDEPSKCEEIVKAFTRPCVTRILESAPQAIDAYEARDLGLTMIKCFNAEFANSHPFGKNTTPECKNAPAHLQ